MLPTGLIYVPDYLSQQEHDCLAVFVDRQPWLADLKRRVQHYGYRYDYKARSINLRMYLGELPDWGQKLAQRLFKDGWMIKQPDQLIVNEYHPGQGISSHIDCVPCFGPVVACLSLGSNCMMDFMNPQTNEVISLLLEPRSLLIMSDESRYEWKHAIKARKNDTYKGKKIVRERRISLTFRTVILNSSTTNANS